MMCKIVLLIVKNNLTEDKYLYDKVSAQENDTQQHDIFACSLNLGERKDH